MVPATRCSNQERAEEGIKAPKAGAKQLSPHRKAPRGSGFDQHREYVGHNEYKQAGQMSFESRQEGPGCGLGPVVLGGEKTDRSGLHC